MNPCQLLPPALAAVLLLTTYSCFSSDSKPEQSTALQSPVTLSAVAPSDIPGGAAGADIASAATFAWQEFIALNWPAVPQTGAVGERGTADASVPFGTPAAGPLTWETYRSRVEIYPGRGNPPGYVKDSSKRYGFDQLPVYTYDPAQVGSYAGLPAGSVPPDVNQAPVAQAAWINLDEDNEIEEDAMFAGVAEGLDYPGSQLLYVAKANVEEYSYVAGNGWWGKDAFSTPPFEATTNYVFTNKATPPPGSAALVSFPSGTIEVKSAWRRLTTPEQQSGRWHTNTARFYVPQKTGQVYGGQPGNPDFPAYREDVLGMAALHIIHKTPSAPYFIYATFEQADNILTSSGAPVEDEAGNLIANQGLNPEDPVIASTPATATTDQILTAQGPFGPSDKRLYFKNLPSTATVPRGPISINRRVHTIPTEIVQANRAFQSAIASYEAANGIQSPWRNYKLVNVQWVPLDKVAGQPYTGPNPESYYLSNSVVETDTNLQTFSGKLANPRDTNGLITDFFNSNNNSLSSTSVYPVGAPASNVPFNHRNYNMGGCMGCHGNIAQLGADFSFILIEQSFAAPEFALDFK